MTQMSSFCIIIECLWLSTKSGHTWVTCENTKGSNIYMFCCIWLYFCTSALWCIDDVDYVEKLPM